MAIKMKVLPSITINRRTVSTQNNGLEMFLYIGLITY